MENLKAKIEYLAQFMLPERVDALKQCLENRTKYLTVCVENTFHPQNASAIIRSCEAFGIQEIHAVETLTKFSPNVRIVRGTDKWIDIHKYNKGQHPTTDLINDLKQKGYRIVATSPHQDDCTPETFDVEAGPIALFFGTEHAGISEEVITNADQFIKIPMYGFVESLNISVCTAIILYQLIQKIRASENIDWAIPDDKKEEILFRWMMESVKDSEGIMKRFKL